MKEEWFLSTSRALRENLSYFDLKISWTVVKHFCGVFFRTSSYVSRGRSWGRTHLKLMKFLYFVCLGRTILVIWGEIFMALKKITIRFSKTQFPCPGKQIEKFFWEKFWIFNLLSTLTKFFLVFGKKIFAQGCQSFIWRVQMKALRILFLKKPWFFVLFAPWAEKFHTFAKHLRQGFQNISLSVQGIFLRKVFFAKLMVSYYFRFSSEKTEEVG